MNGLANAFVFAEELARIRGCSVFDIEFDDQELDFNAMILGDDNITCCHNRFEPFLKTGRFEAALLELGFKSKLTFR